MLLTLASVVVVVAGLKAAAPLLVPFVLALFLAALTLPVLSWLQRRRVPTGIAVAVAVLVDLLLIGLVVALVSGSVTGFIEAAPRYRLRLQAMVEATVLWLEGFGLPASEWLTIEGINPSALLDLVGSTVRGVASVLKDLLLVVLIVVFLLLEATGFPERLHVALGRAPERQARWQKVRHDVQRYLVIKTLVSAATGFLVGLGVGLIGLDFPLLWGLIAFLANYIPNLGSILAAIPAVTLSLVQLGLGRTLLVAAVYLLVNIALGNLLEPQLMGRRLGLSPLVVFLSLVFWGWVWGPVGMVLSVPLTVIVRIVLENSPDLRWIAVLLAARVPEEPAVASGAPPAAEVGAIEAPGGPGGLKRPPR